MRVVVAPDKFEGSLRAGEAAAAIEAGLRRARPDAEVVRLPLGDGGAGTLDALVAAGFQRVPARVTGPTGEPVEAAIAVDGRRAFVEMAEASGLKRLAGGRRWRRPPTGPASCSRPPWTAGPASWSWASAAAPPPTAAPAWPPPSGPGCWTGTG